MRRLRAMAVAVVLVASLLVPVADVAAADPSVTVVGSFQSELGCGGDWQADCATTHLAYDAGDDVWQGTFNVPAGNWGYKAAINDSFAENYGLHAQKDGLDIPLNLASVPTSSSTTTRRATGSPITALGHRRRPRQLPVRAWVPGRLGSRLPRILAPGPRWRRHLCVRDDRATEGHVRVQGRDQRGPGT
jgi:hypothetical protein